MGGFSDHAMSQHQIRLLVAITCKPKLVQRFGFSGNYRHEEQDSIPRKPKQTPGHPVDLKGFVIQSPDGKLQLVCQGLFARNKRSRRMVSPHFLFFISNFPHKSNFFCSTQTSRGWGPSINAEPSLPPRVISRSDGN